ncbi:hypothetical protein JI742_01460 [Piscinibacter sp. Jin2]|uniref:EF-hand domain-containing protein n=1 Tax=Aquariibacter lacus TaxID=2801332 RepID=A0A9X0XBJ6_9BURK|nr:hypothetical protein [Piscinibacter lacus]MBL0718544.1 hypothetical protein [Piscinibacter lacus]
MLKTTLALLMSLTFAAGVMAQGKETGRDWTKIDTNKDGYISPEEMAAWLKANPGPGK